MSGRVTGSSPCGLRASVSRPLIRRSWLPTRFYARLSACLALLLGFASACGHSGVYHRVQPGENLYRIGKAYGYSYTELATINHLGDPGRIEVGQEIFVPGAKRQLPVDIITPRTASSQTAVNADDIKDAPRLIWPVNRGSVASEFGQRGPAFHDGIDIRAPVGTPVHAAADGNVIYSDVLRGYGNVIIVRHSGGFATVYAHNQSNKASEGARVHTGDVIATVGDSGRTTGPNLHFEVRQDNTARDPILFLPPSEQVAAPAAGDRGGSVDFLGM
jgi:lipoprotein NlpD